MQRQSVGWKIEAFGRPNVYVEQGSTLPIQGTPNSAGFDLVAHKDVLIAPNSTEVVPTNLYIALPPFMEAQIRPRSGISLGTKLRVANSPGTIDADYRGEVGVILDNNHKRDPFLIKKGDRIAQVVFVPVIHPNFVLVDKLPETERGDGGFGSTGLHASVNFKRRRLKPDEHQFIREQYSTKLED